MANWFVKVSGLANENIVAMLAAEGEVGGTEYHALRDTSGTPHDLLLIPPRYFKRLRTAKREQPAVYRDVRFFVQDIPGGPVRAANFLEQQRAPAVVRKALADLRERQRERR